MIDFFLDQLLQHSATAPSPCDGDVINRSELKRALPTSMTAENEPSDNDGELISE